MPIDGNGKGSRIGLRYGRLTVVGKSLRSNANRAYWDCLCDCGNETFARSDALTSGATESCGCKQREVAAMTGAATRKHDYQGTPVYGSWSHMKARCYNINDPKYPNYGGRGITVCDDWQSFMGFLNDMGIPEKGMTIERVDVNKGYSKDNCIWADALTQNRNRTISVRVVTDDGVLPVKDYAEMFGISYNAARSRAYRGSVPTVRVGELS